MHQSGEPMNRLNYQALEKFDVITGLLDYANLGRAHAERLIELYGKGSRKPFGDSLAADCLREELAAFCAEAGTK